MTIKITSASFHACVVGKEGLPKDDLPIIALVGRSNVGKSSLVNVLAQRRELARTSSTPGKTLTINFYLFNEMFYLVDLPGYGYAKASKTTKKAIQAMMNEFFGECDRLKGIIQILDARHKPSALDLNMFSWIRDQKYNYLSIITKIDKLSNQQAGKMRKQILRELGVDSCLMFSSKTGSGRDDVLDALEKIVSGLILTKIKKRAPKVVKKKTKHTEGETSPKNEENKKRDNADKTNKTGSQRRKRRRPRKNSGNKPKKTNPTQK